MEDKGKSENLEYLKHVKLWKIAFALLFFASGFYGLILDTGESIPLRIVTAILCFAIGVVPVYLDIKRIKRPAAELWSMWDQVEGVKQEERKMRAASGELTPMKVDVMRKEAVFVGSTADRYRTNLTRCTCPDFQKRGVPCKHMYYLAEKCGVETLGEHW